MSVEKRHNARGSIDVRESGVTFFLKCEDGVYAITRVRDVSLSGVGIETRYKLKPGEKIALKYRSRDFRLSVDGSVIWCSPNGSHAYTLGVSFNVNNREKNSIFFLALRKYLDDFDGAYIDA